MIALPGSMQVRFNPIRFVVFDLDGTLVDSAPGVAWSLRSAFSEAGRTMPASDLRSVIGPPIAAIARRLEPSLSDAEVGVIERAYRKSYDNEGWRETEAFPGVASTLAALQASGLAMFIVTNKPRLPATQVLDRLGIGEVFQEVLTRDTRTPHYPSKRAMLEELLLRQGLASAVTLMVGDTPEDEEAAEANGVAFVHARYGYGSHHVARYGIDAFAELATLLAHQQTAIAAEGPASNEI